MYRHLLVPIDDTELSTVTIGHAVEFAHALGARITFFHALPDYASSITGDADIVRMTAPEDYAYSFEGRARELLTKAESAARARGVPCASATAVSEAAPAIVDAARASGCDLIFMASHGRPSKIGMMLGSQTLKVLIDSEIPVLVSSTKLPPAPMLANGILRDEHRSLAAVIHAWLDLLRAAASGGPAPDPVLLRAIVHYLKNFPRALHHPKETDFLFAKLRQRTSRFDADLDELERQHDRDRALVAELEELVERYCDGSLSLAELAAAVNRYATCMWEHMGREEGVILPAARRHLTEDDWAEINAAFHNNGDPRFGGDTDAEFKHLFSRIVNLASS